MSVQISTGHGTPSHRLRLCQMRDDNLIRRNAVLLAQAEKAKAKAREIGADVLDQQSKLSHPRTRMRKLLWARAMWPLFMRRLVRGQAHSPW